MINPNDIVRDDYTDVELEELLLFCICVANKPAKTIAPRVNRLYTFLQLWVECTVHTSPSATIYPNSRLIFPHVDRWPSSLSEILKDLGIGCYTQKAETIRLAAVADLDLRWCDVDELEAIKGIGPKTANAFIMWSRPNEQRAILDTHILKWLKKVGVPKVPRSSPPRGPVYDRLEQEFLSRVPEGMTPAEFDLEIWKEYSNA